LTIGVSLAKGRTQASLDKEQAQSVGDMAAIIVMVIVMITIR